MQITVIIPFFNSCGTIKRAVDSVERQQGEFHFCIIIVDDGSRIEQWESLQKINSTVPNVTIVKYRLPENRGAAAARNFGIEQAKSQFIAFLDADDEWLEHKTKLQIKTFKDLPRIAMVCGGKEVVNVAVTVADVEDAGYVGFDTLLSENIVTTSSVMLNLNNLGDFKFPPLRRRQDYAAWLTIAANGGLIYSLNEVLVRYHVLKGSLSRNPVLNLFYNYQCFRLTGLTVWGSISGVWKNIQRRIIKKLRKGY